jgi:hypothetical protein
MAKGLKHGGAFFSYFTDALRAQFLIAPSCILAWPLSFQSMLERLDAQSSSFSNL